MNGIIFDLDGVLVNSMPLHYQSWNQAFQKIVNFDIDERSIYLLEGMRGLDLVKELFKKCGYKDYSKAELLTRTKDEIFRSQMNIKPYEGAKKMLQTIKCYKGLVSGSNTEDVMKIVDDCFSKDLFDVIITGDDVKKGKPDPSPFRLFLNQMNLSATDAYVVENSPFGVQAAKNASISCMVVLNNSPLQIKDFENLIPSDNIYSETKDIIDTLLKWCV